MPSLQFSIVIPVRNGEKYITSALNSALKQTYPHFNIFILENCSEDRTPEILNSYNDPRIKIVPAEKALGIEDNWARILDLALNEYVTILAHDDVLYPNFLQEIARLIEVEPKAAFYHTHFHFTNSEGIVLRQNYSVPYRETGDEFLLNVHRFKEEFSGSGFVVRSLDYKHVGGLPPFRKLLFSDGFFWYRISQLSYKVCSPKSLYTFRMHEQSATGSSNILDFHTAGQQYLDALEKTGHFQSPENRRLAYRFVATFLQGRYRRFLHTLIKARGPRNLGDIAKLKATAASHNLSFDTPSLQFYEWIARIPWRLARMVIFRITNVMAVASTHWSRVSKRV